MRSSRRSKRSLRRIERDGVPVPSLDLSAPPAPQPRSPSSVEFDQLAILDVEAALLRSDDASSLDVPAARACEALEEPLSDALARLDATLDPDFVAFCEAASVRGAALHVISRGFKPIARHFLREAGLGHVAVLANELHVGTNNRWRVSFRDGSPSGHDKARSLKAALRLLDGERRVVHRPDGVRRGARRRRPRPPPVRAGGSASAFTASAPATRTRLPGWTALARG